MQHSKLHRAVLSGNLYSSTDILPNLFHSFHLRILHTNFEGIVLGLIPLSDVNRYSLTKDRVSTREREIMTLV